MNQEQLAYERRVLIDRKKRQLEFTNERQDSVMDLITQYIQSHRMLDLCDLSNTKELKGHVDEGDFFFLFDNILDAASQLKKTIAHPECPFPNTNCFITYRDAQLVFHRMVNGADDIEISMKSDFWKTELALSYEEIKACQASQKEE